jgi:serine/threonine protein kinase
VAIQLYGPPEIKSFTSISSLTDVGINVSREQQYVAIKISVSELEEESREIQVLRAIAAMQSDEPGSRHLMFMIDHFRLDGPNGTHHCLVLELLGQNIPDQLERHYNDERIPKQLATMIAKQALLGLDCLHQQKIAHGGRCTSLHPTGLTYPC